MLVPYEGSSTKLLFWFMSSLLVGLHQQSIQTISIPQHTMVSDILANIRTLQSYSWRIVNHRCARSREPTEKHVWNVKEEIHSITFFLTKQIQSTAISFFELWTKNKRN